MLTKLKALFTSKGKGGAAQKAAQAGLNDTIRIVTIGPESSGKSSFWHFLLQPNPDRPELPLHIELEFDKPTQELMNQSGIPEPTQDDVLVYHGNILYGDIERRLEIVDIRGGLVGDTASEMLKCLDDVVKNAHLLLFFQPPELLKPGKETEYNEVISRFLPLMGTALKNPPKSINVASPLIGVCFTKADQYGFLPLPDPRILHSTQSTAILQTLCRNTDASKDALNGFMQSLTASQATSAIGADVSNILRRSEDLWGGAIKRGHRFINAYWIATGASDYDSRYNDWYARGGHQLLSDFAEHLRLFFPYKVSAGYHKAVGYRYRISFLAISFIALVWTAADTGLLLGERSSSRAFELKNLANYPPIEYNIKGLTVKPGDLAYRALSLEEVNSKLAQVNTIFAAYVDKDERRQDLWEAMKTWQPQYPSDITRQFVTVLKNRVDVYQKFSQLTQAESPQANPQLFAEFTALYYQDQHEHRYQNHLSNHREQIPIDTTLVNNTLKNPQKKRQLREAAIDYFNALKPTGTALTNYLDIAAKFDLRPVPKTCMSPRFRDNDEKILYTDQIRAVKVSPPTDGVYLIQLQHIHASTGSPSLALVWRKAPGTEIFDVLLERNITGRNIKTLSVADPGLSINLDEWRVSDVGYVRNYASDSEIRKDLIAVIDAAGEAPSLEKMLRVSLADTGSCRLKQNHARVMELIRPVAQKLLGK